MILSMFEELQSKQLNKTYEICLKIVGLLNQSESLLIDKLK